MTQYHLIEDKFPKKLPILLSYDIINRIELIKEYNRNNTDALSQWYDYIETVESYISDPVIAWDTMGRHIKFPNGARLIKDFDFNVGYSIKFNKRGAYVYVFKMNLKTDEYGLNIPPSLTEVKNVIRLTESMLKAMVAESLMHILNEYHEYKPVSHNKEITLNNGVKVKSLVTLSDGAGVYEIWEDDGCYVCCDMNYYRNNEDYQPMYIFPELLSALKDLPNLPLR